MTKAWVKIFKMLSENNIKPGTKSWRDYERAKKAINSMTMTPAQYTQVIHYIADYIGV